MSHPLRSTRPRQTALAALATLSLIGAVVATSGAAGAAQSAPPGRSAIANPQRYLYLDADTSSEGCTVSGKAAEKFATVTPGKPQTTTTLAFDKHIVSSSNTSDDTHVTGQATSTGNVLTAGGLFSRLNFKAVNTLTVDRSTDDAGSLCNLYGYNADSNQTVSATVPAGWFTLAVRAEGEGQTNVFLSRGEASRIDLLTDAAGGTKVKRVFVPAGSYAIGAQEYLDNNNGGNVTSSGDESHSGTGLGLIQYYKAGAAPAAQTGTATPYVTLPGVRTCTTGATTAKVTSKAASVKKVTVTVKGTTTLKSVVNPTSDAAVTVPGAKAKPVTVNVKVTLNSGAVKTGSRAYLACTG